jgi:hypothetical protein
MGKLSRTPLENQQPGLITLARRLLGNQLRRQSKIKLTGAHNSA